jgi:hypothetical protein
MIRPGDPTPELSGHGQPRPEVKVAPRQPSAAERSRTLVEGNSSLALTIPGLRPEPAEPMVPLRQSLGPHGDVLLLFPHDSPAVRAVRHAADDEAGAVLEITDVAPVAVPHRIRGRAWLTGWLTAVPPELRLGGPPGDAFEAGTELLRLETGEITVDDLWGASLVEPDEFAAAEADPLRACETEVLQHLAAAHAAEVGLLCRLVGPAPVTGGPAAAEPTAAVPAPAAGPSGSDRSATGLAAGGCAPRSATSAVPLALDRFGLRVRFLAAGGNFDARFDFPEPVDGPEGARRALRALFAAARDDG